MPHRFSLAFITFTLVIDSMGFGLIMPVLPDLITALSDRSMGEAAIWGGIIVASFAGMRFLTGPLLGSLSDRFGRRPVLVGSMSLLAVNYAIMALAGSLWVLLVGRIIGGMTSASQTTGTAFITDISTEETKAKRFGLVGAALGVGFVLGPILGGLLSEFGIRAPFIAAAVLAGANALFGLLVLPESLAPANRRAFSWARSNPLGALRSVTKLRGTGAMLTFSFALSLAGMAYAVIWPFWGAETFGWSTRMISFTLAVYGISLALMQGLVIRPILDRLGETRTVILGATASLAAFLALPFITNGWIVVLFIPLGAFATIATPALTAQLSARTDKDAQGELQGVIGSLYALAMVIAPLLMSVIFARFTATGASIYMPGAPYVVAALLVALAFPLYVIGIRKTEIPKLAAQPQAT
ncbi:MAG: TCR/Tet family MFS transporter [Maritimibacter sp.]